MKYLLLCLLGLMLLPGEMPAQGVIGHRGARAHLPENTLPGFILATESGAHGLEMDLVLSRDHKVIVSHDPWFEHEICQDSSGQPIPKSAEKDHLIYEMTAAQVAGYDCGCLGHPDFPTQKAISAYKPQLAEVVQAVDSTMKAMQRAEPLTYFLEIKSWPRWEPEMQPGPQVVAGVIYQEIKRLKLENRAVVMSFDKRILREMRALDSTLSFLLLTADPRGLGSQIRSLGFQPDYIAPFHKLLSKRMIRQAHNRGMKVAAWTVNDPADMLKLVEKGLDLIITDDPALAIREFQASAR